MGAATAAEIGEVVDGFVTAVGAGVEPGPPRRRPATTDADLDLGGGPPRHGTAEALSIAGLLLEQAPPHLLLDAHSTLVRLECTAPRNADASGVGEGATPDRPKRYEPTTDDSNGQGNSLVPVTAAI